MRWCSSTQHDEETGYDALREAVMETIVKPVLSAEMLSAKTKYFVNPTGRSGRHYVGEESRRGARR